MTKETRTSDLEQQFTELVDRYLTAQGLAIEEIIERLILDGIPLEWLKENVVVETVGKPTIITRLDRAAGKMKVKISEEVRLRLKHRDDAA